MGVSILSESCDCDDDESSDKHLNISTMRDIHTAHIANQPNRP